MSEPAADAGWGAGGAHLSPCGGARGGGGVGRGVGMGVGMGEGTVFRERGSAQLAVLAIRWGRQGVPLAFTSDIENAWRRIRVSAPQNCSQML